MTSTKAQLWDQVCAHDKQFLTFLCELPQVSQQPTAEVILELLGQTGEKESFVHHLLMRRFKSAVMTESKDITSSLRDNSLPVLLLSSLALSPPGISYLKDVTQGPLGKASAHLDELNIGPNLPEGTNFEERVDKLVATVDELLTSLVSSVDQIPLPILRAAHLVQEESVKRLKELGLDDTAAKEGSQRLVTLFFFVRFFNPIVTNPEYYPGLGKMAPNQTKGAVWISKCLTTLSNGIAFGGKEPAFVVLDQKLAAWRTKIPEFLDRILAAPREGEQERPRPVEPERWETATDTFVTFLTKSFPKMEGAGGYEGTIKETAAALQALLKKLGEDKGDAPRDPTAATASPAATPAAAPAPAAAAAAAAPAPADTGAEKPKHVVKPPKAPAQEPPKKKESGFPGFLLGVTVLVVAVLYYVIAA